MLNNLSPVVKNLILVNIVVFLCTDFIAVNSGVKLYLVEWFVKHPNFKVWQPLTAMFVHFDFRHLLFNMIGLLIFGPALEQWMNSKRFLFFYIACGAGAFVLSLTVNYILYYIDLNTLISAGEPAAIAKSYLINGKFLTISAGASGAVYGVTAGAVYLFPNRTLLLFPIPVPVKFKWLGIITVGYAALATLRIIETNDNIGHAAHLGGAIFGFIMVWYWKRNSMDKYRWN